MNIEDRKAWVAFVRAVRSHLQWSMREMAAALGTTSSTIGRWEDESERGRTPTGPAKKSLIELARKHGLVE